MKKKTIRAIVATLLLLAIIVSCLPVLGFAVDAETTVFSPITSLDDLADGKYVMVVEEVNKALGALDGTWMLAQDVIISDGTITNPGTAAVYTITKSENGYKLTDPNGKFVAPGSGNTNSARELEYEWEVVCENGLFVFKGRGTDTTTLAFNKNTSYYKFRAYKNATVASGEYPYRFTLYKEMQHLDPPVTQKYAGLKLSKPADKDELLIYSIYGKAVMASGASGSKMGSVAAEPSEGKIAVTDGMAVVTVREENSTAVSLIVDGKYLTSGATGNSLALSDTLSDLGLWEFEKQEDGTWYVHNVGAAYNGNNNQYLEYYSGFTTFSRKDNNDQYKFELYAVGEEPETPVEPPVDPPVEEKTAYYYPDAPDAGDVILIYHAYSANVMADSLSGNKMGGVEAVNLDEKITLTEGMGLITVEDCGDGKIAFRIGDKYVTSGATGNSMSLETELSDLGKWELEKQEDGTWYIHNVGANYNGNYTQYLEYYNGFTTYGRKDNNGSYKFSFYMVEKNQPEEPPIEEKTAYYYPDAPDAGDVILIYHSYSANVMADSLSGNKMGGVEAVNLDEKITLTDGMGLITVEDCGDGKIAFRIGDKYVTSGKTGNSMTLETELSDLGKWELEKQEDGTWYIHNVGANYNGNYNQYLEYYSGFTTYGKKDNNNAYKFTFYMVQKAKGPKEGLVESLEDLEDGDTVVIYNEGHELAITSELNNSWYLSGTSVTIADGKIANPAGPEVWTVSVKDGVYTFTQGDKTISAWLSGTYVELSNETKYDNGWKLTECNAENHKYYISSSVLSTSYGDAYIECYYKSACGGDVFCGYSTGASRLTEKDYGFQFYHVIYNAPDQPADELPKDGDEVVIYNATAEGVIGLEDTMGVSMSSAGAVIEDGKAVCENGARVFTVEREGKDFAFKSDGKYLATNNNENLFLQETKDSNALWNLEEKNGGYIIKNKSANYNGTPVSIEYYSGSFSGWTFKSSDADIFIFNFYPVAGDTPVTDGIVNKPKVIFDAPDAYLGMDYTFSFAVNDVFGVKGDLTVTVNGESVFPGEDGKYIVPAEMLENTEELNIEVRGVDNAGASIYGNVTVKVKDEPVITEVSPAQNAETGEDLRPVISASFINAGEDPDVVMTVNGEKVECVVADGKATYTPVADMTEGRTTVIVTVERKDGMSATKIWSFVVGTSKYQLYFGQLHSHTAEYSDGAGTLAAGLDYIKNLPESANVQFVAFTDHSNYFDSTSAANPEGALYNKALMTAESAAKWAAYNAACEEFNEKNAGLLALPGFEMTWSGGPGHINTWNTNGIVSRNNTTLNNKTNDAGLKAYYALLSQNEGADSISQFNHPGTTFGNFVDFSYWDAVIDSRVYLLEVGNGEGQVGEGGYYPSYEQYTMALDKGWHVAPTNNQDNHKGKWGNANDARDVILTDDFSVEGLYAAIRAMRVYATEDKNLEISYTLNGEMLGTIIDEVPEKLEINVNVYDPDKADNITKVEVVANSGKVVYTWSDPSELENGDLSVTLEPDYSYYFIRVTEGDGDLAVTAPVWVGETMKLGISDFVSGTSTPVTGEEIELTTTLFNSEAGNATVKSLTYTVDGSNVIGTDMAGYTIPASGTVEVKFKTVFDTAKVYTVTVTAVVELDGIEYTFTKDLTLDVLKADDLVYIGIDAAHYNEYVAGNYKDSMGNFGALAASYNVRTVELKTSEELIAACSNDKFVAMIFTAPSRRLAAAQSDPRSYMVDEINAIKAFNDNGGMVIVAGWSDYYENYEVILNNEGCLHMAETQNSLLKALGTGLRVGDDATHDDELNGGQTQRLYFSTYNFDSFLMEGVELDEENPNNRLYSEVFSQYGGCSVFLDDTVETEGKVTNVVFGHESTYLKDSDGDSRYREMGVKYEYKDGDMRYVVLATDEREDKGTVIVSGAAFMSNFEVQATVEDSGSEKNYSNYKVCENLLKKLNPVKVTPIDEVRKQTEAGYKYTIEGIVTSNASGYDKDTAFFDCIYVQDETGGICCFPVAGNFKVGDKVRVTGTTDFYQGEPELQVTSIEKIGEGEVEPTEVTAKDINDLTHLGELITVKGTVIEIGYAEGLVQTIMVKDENGNICRVFIDGYITKDKEIPNLEVGCLCEVTGLSSYDDTFNAPNGPFPRIRVRDRADVICKENPNTGDNSMVFVWMSLMVLAAAGYVSVSRKRKEF